MSDIIIKPTDWNIIAAKYNIKPGDRLILTGKSRAEIQFQDLKDVTVISDEPIVIKGINPGGRVVQFSNSIGVHITGINAPIEITGGAQALDFRDLSYNVEADHLYIHDVGYLAIAAKTDPTCDPKTWRGAFVLDGVWLHHNRIDGCKTGEGFYIGESHYHTVGAIQGGPCASGNTTAPEHEVRNVIIEDNDISNTGADGIQVGACPTGALIRRNKVTNYGMNKVYGQTAGIICNPGTVGQVYENRVDTGVGFAIQLQGPGGSVVRNNIILNAGSADQGGGIMQVNYIANGGVDQIYNNTFINTRRVGVEYYGPIEFKNNILNTLAGIPFYKQGGSSGKLTKTGNIELSGDPEQLRLDANYTPLPGSPAYGPTSDSGAVQSVKTVTETGTIQVITTGAVSEVYITTPSGKRIKLQ